MNESAATAPTFPLIAKTFSGLESVLADELAALGARDVKIGRRMVSFEADQALLYRANLCLRTAVRILQPIAAFRIDPGAADAYRSLYAGVQTIDWQSYLRPSGTLAIDPVVHGQVLTNSLYAAQVTKDAIADWFRERFGERPSVDRQRPDVRINLHVAGDEATLYLDASGQSLHKRGYRRLTGEAPLNEVLAAGILRLTGWDGRSALVDFLCGSGTLPIEAALIARNIAPGLLRDDFGYRRWLDFDSQLEAQVIDEVRQSVRPADATPTIFASDIDPAVIAAARENAARAGVTADVAFQVANFENLEPPAEQGTIVLNPPYDERLKVAGIGAFYRRIGQALAGRWRGYTAWILVGNLEAAQQIGLRPAASFPLRNGPIDCRLLRFEIDGSSTRSTTQTSGKQSQASRSSPLEALRSRLARMGKHWARWARRQEISCYRVYDGDLPEVPWTIDRYQDRLHIVEHDSPHGRSPLEHREWFDALVKVAGEVLGVEADDIHAHPDEKSISPSTPQGKSKVGSHDRIVVEESGHKIEVDLGRRDDTGLSPEMRSLRQRSAEEARGLRFLNLFDRSGSASVFAGGARSTATLVQSAGFARWTKHNFQLNSLAEPDHVVIEADPLEWIERMAQAGATPFDLVLVAPPAGYHRRHDTRAWNPREEYRQLLDGLRPLLAERGKIYFASSVRRFRLDPADVPWATTRDVSAQLLPADCRTKPRLRVWSLLPTA